MDNVNKYHKISSKSYGKILIVGPLRLKPSNFYNLIYFT
jgi:hypothetical protein